MSRVIHFEIPAAEPDRAAAFYGKVFGWKFDKWPGPMEYWMVLTGKDGEPGINGGMVRRMGPAPAEGQPVNCYCCTVAVSSVDDYVAKATAGGGTVAVPKMPIPGVGWLAYVKDTEGNILGLMASDPTAH